MPKRAISFSRDPQSAKSINSYAKPIRGRIAYAEALVFQGYERPRRG